MEILLLFLILNSGVVLGGTSEEVETQVPQKMPGYSVLYGLAQVTGT